jgi:uncharacterized protein YndB with AHSA1/START domain
MPANMPATSEKSSEREIVGTRVFHAPRELVWKVFTDPGHVAQWWGPNGFTNTIHEMDVRPGGEWNLTMHGPDGTDYANKSIYHELVEPERIVYSHVSGPLFEAIITFTAKGDKTEVNWRMVFESAELRDKVAHEFGAVGGLNQTIGRLGDKLATFERRLVLERVFDAPRELVFKAWIDPEQLAQWWGPHGFTNPLCEADARPGGAIRIDMKGPDGTVFPMGGTFHEIVEPEKLVMTTTAMHDEAGNPKLAVLNIVTFTDHGGKTKLVLHAIVVTATDEAAFALQGMEQGWTESLERLADLVKKSRLRVDPAEGRSTHQ